MKFFDDALTDSRYPNFILRDFLNARNVEFKENGAEDHIELSMNCPKCHERGEPTPDRKQKLWINEKTGFGYCYRCNFTGSLPKLIGALANTSFEGALKILRGNRLDPMEHLDLKLFEETFEPDEEEESLRDVELPQGYTPIDGPHGYLEKRGIPWKYAAKHDWGTSDVGFCKDRLIVPTFMNDHLVFWQARATWESKDKEFRKVLNPKGVSARSVLFNYDEAKKFEMIVIVEGFIDAVKIGPDAVATNGKRLHARQVEWLRKSKAKRIVLAWDADAWSDERRNRAGEVIKKPSIWQAADMLSMFFEVSAVKLPKGQDPGSFPFLSDELRSMIEKAETLNASELPKSLGAI